VVKIKKIEISKFRALEPGSSFQLGDRITLIAGGNGTAKSTLLGMLCQPLGFSSKTKAKSIYTNCYDGIDLRTLKTIGNKAFKAEYSDVFRMSSSSDKPREHEYTIFFSGDNLNIDSFSNEQSLHIRSEGRKGHKIRFVTNSTNRKVGSGNFPHPVIYLGLQRLRPLATCPTHNICKLHSLEPKDEKYYIDNYKEIFVDTTTLSPESIVTKTFKGNYLSIKTPRFGSDSTSAGQDNIGQMLTAILSFKRLKERLGDKYQGGMILIDEIDATLHAVSQLNLVNYLIASSHELDLQIVATTHSLFLLKNIKKSDVSLVFLKKVDDKIKVANDVEYEAIEADLSAMLPNIKTRYQTSILFEDSVAADFFKKVTKGIFSEYVDIYNSEQANNDTCVSRGILKTLSGIAPKKIPELQKMIFVLDGDWSAPYHLNS